VVCLGFVLSLPERADGPSLSIENIHTVYAVSYLKASVYLTKLVQVKVELR
jgi:hypothetical protein